MAISAKVTAYVFDRWRYHSVISNQCDFKPVCLLAGLFECSVDGGSVRFVCLLLVSMCVFSDGFIFLFEAR